MPLEEPRNDNPERLPAKGGRGSGGLTAAMRYERAENIVFVWHPVPVHLDTREDIAR